MSDYDKVDMSLDDIIKKYHRDGRGSRGYRRGGRKGGWRAVERGRRNNWSHDWYGAQSFKREGAASFDGTAKLMISNLEYGVSDSDIYELFSDFGRLKQASVHYDRSGRSLGTADIIFSRKSDAIKALQEYNGVPLDGREMKIEMTMAPENKLPFINHGCRQRTRSFGGVEKRHSRGGQFGGSGRKWRRFAAPSLEELDEEMDTYNEMKK